MFYCRSHLERVTKLHNVQRDRETDFVKNKNVQRPNPGQVLSQFDHGRQIGQVWDLEKFECSQSLVRPQQTFTFAPQAEKEENLVSKVQQLDNNVKQLKDEVIVEEGKEEKTQQKNTAEPSPRLFLRWYYLLYKQWTIPLESDL